jgi:seryl-tRNA synthetase
VSTGAFGALPPGLLPDPDAIGIHGRDAGFEEVLKRLDTAITSLDPSARPEAMRFPPVIGRRTIERCGYLHSFPHLLGTVHSFVGDDRAQAALVQAARDGGDWSAYQVMTDVALTPAACYAVYPRAVGILPSNGLLVDVESWCFRQEPTDTPERIRSFRMREFVRLGSPATVVAWRTAWLTRAQIFLSGLGLEPDIAPANDPFFGAGARFLAMSQREQELKFEINVEVRPGVRAAGISCNYHLEHFGTAFGIRTSDGDTAHTACVGFGLERLALALYTAHGPKTEAWPPNLLNA